MNLTGNAKTYELHQKQGDEYYYDYQDVVDPRSGEKVFGVSNLAKHPEDAVIGRDLFDAYDWLNAVKLGITLANEGFTTVVLKEKND